MILKDDHKVTVEEIDGLIVKSFKPGHELLRRPNFLSKDWGKRINEFSLVYGNLPQVVEFSEKRIVTTKVTGQPLRVLLQRPRPYNQLQSNFPLWIENYKKCQFSFFQMINNFLEYNLAYEHSLVHGDLTLQNVFVENNVAVCIDVDSVEISTNPVDHNWITMPFCDMTHIQIEMSKYYIKKSLN